MEVDDLKDFRKRYKNSGIYCTAYRYNNEVQAEAEMYGNLYLDFDSDSDDLGYEQVKDDAIAAISFFSSIFGISDSQIRIFFSGKKGVHLIVPAAVLGVNPDKDLNEIFRCIALDVQKVSRHKTVDTRIYDRVRLFRLPNSIHPDTGLYKVPLTYDEFMSFNYDEVKEHAKSRQKQGWEKPKYNTKANRVYKEYIEQRDKEKRETNMSKKKGNGTLKYCPPCIKHMLKNVTPDGKRNNTAAALTSYYKQRGLSEEEAFEKMKKWSSEYCDPPIKAGELKTTVQSIYSGQYQYGCRTLAELSGACDTSRCKLVKK